jgi:hypothetical protein
MYRAKQLAVEYALHIVSTPREDMARTSRAYPSHVIVMVKGLVEIGLSPPPHHLLVNPGPHLSPPTRSLAVEQSTTILSLPQVDTSLFIVDPCVTSQYSLSINISAVLVIPFKCLVRELCIDIPGAPPPYHLPLICVHSLPSVAVLYSRKPTYLGKIQFNSDVSATRPMSGGPPRHLPRSEP